MANISEIVNEVIAQLKAQGINVSSSENVERIDDINTLLGIGTNTQNKPVIKQIKKELLNQKEEANATAIDTEIKRAQNAEKQLQTGITTVTSALQQTSQQLNEKIKGSVAADSLRADVTSGNDHLTVLYADLEGKSHSFIIPPATDSNVGVMSASDKNALNSIVYMGEFVDSRAAENKAVEYADKHVVFLYYKTQRGQVGVIQQNIEMAGGAWHRTFQFLSLDGQEYVRVVLPSSNTSWHNVTAVKRFKSLGYDANSSTLYLLDFNDENKHGTVTLPEATETTAGLMSAQQYINLESLVYFLSKLGDSLGVTRIDDIVGKIADAVNSNGGVVANVSEQNLIITSGATVEGANISLSGNNIQVQDTQLIIN